jgi:hypothetical protein
MGMPSGDSPAKAHQYYEYLQVHDQTLQVPATWHVHWLDLAWLWGFVIALGRDVAVGLAVPLDPQKAGSTRSTSSVATQTDARGPGDLLLPRSRSVADRLRCRLDRGHIIWGQKF